MAIMPSFQFILLKVQNSDCDFSYYKHISASKTFLLSMKEYHYSMVLHKKYHELQMLHHLNKSAKQLFKPGVIRYIIKAQLNCLLNK